MTKNTKKQLKRFQDDLTFYIAKKNALSKTQLATSEQAGYKKGLITSLWPIINFFNLLENYNHKKGFLYFLFHPTTVYKPGKRVFFPNAQIYYGALYKRLKLSLYLTEEIDIRHRNLVNAELLIREIKYCRNADPYQAKLRLCREMLDQMHIKELKREQDGYYKLLRKKISEMENPIIHQAMNGKDLSLVHYRNYLLEKEKFLNTLTEVISVDQFISNQDYSYDAFVKFKEEHPHQNYKLLIEDFIQAGLSGNTHSRTSSCSATQLLHHYTVFPKERYISFSKPPGNPKQTPEKWADQLYLKIIHKTQRSKIALFNDFPPEYIDYYRALQEKIATEIRDEQERPYIVLKIRGQDVGYQRTVNIGLAGGTGPLSDAHIIEKTILERAECRDHQPIQEEDREKIRFALKNFSGVLYSMPPPRDASHAAKDGMRYLALYSSVRESIPCRSLHILTNTGHLNKQIFNSQVLLGSAALGVVDDMTHKIADQIKIDIEKRYQASPDQKKDSVLVLGTIKADQEQLYMKLLTERNVSSAYPRGQFKAGTADNIFLQEMIDQAKKNLINKPMSGLKITCGEALVHFIVQQVKETGTNFLLFGCTEIPMILNTQIPNRDQTYQQLLTEKLNALPRECFYYDSEELFTTIIKERSKELESLPLLEQSQLTASISEKSINEKKLKRKELEQLIISHIDKFKKRSDEKSIHKKNMLFAIKQFLSDSNPQKLQLAKLANPRWDESTLPFDDGVKSLVDRVEHSAFRETEQKQEFAKQECLIEDNLMNQPKAIERIVCSGGGAKGIVYPGAYRALLDSGVYNQAKQFSGASVGAITAAFMAVGIPSNQFREQLLNTNFNDLMGKFVEGSGLGVSTILGKNITKTGIPLLEFIQKNINSSIRAKLHTLGFLSGAAHHDEQLSTLITKIQTSSENTLKITFGDLAVLNQHLPEHFKQLTIPAVRYPNGELQIFNSELTPDVEIALACRASSSLPVLLKPQAIMINGQEQLFVDGGLYDNIPTDYFDREATHFLGNKKPDQTLVFAFGEGLNDKKNQMFQACYGQRIDETIADQLVEDIINSTLNLIKVQPKNNKTEVVLFKTALSAVIAQSIESKHFKKEKADFIKNNLEKTIEKLLLNPKEHIQFWKQYEQENDHGKRIALLSTFIKEQMKPVLYDAGVIERLKRNVLVKKLSGLATPYTNTGQKELAYQKLRSDYSLRTVELRVGNIKTTDFVPARYLARVMDALGYLHTINHITNHDLHDSKKFNAHKFFNNLINNFDSIYQAVLVGAGKDPSQDKLILEINDLRFQLQLQDKSEDVINRQLYQLIQDYVERNLDSAEAFALSRTVEYNNNNLSSDALFKETYEQGFKRSGTFASSNITGRYIMKGSTLQQALADKNLTMFSLYRKQASLDEKTRTNKVFYKLLELQRFKIDYKSNQEQHQKVSIKPK